MASVPDSWLGKAISPVDNLPHAVFRSGRHQRMFKKFIGVSQNLIDRGKYRSARAMMEFLRRRTDGTGNDWIVNPAAQDAMMDLLDMQISSLVEQIEGYNKNGRRPRQSPTTTVSLFFTHLVVAWARAVELIPFFGLAA